MKKTKIYTKNPLRKHPYKAADIHVELHKQDFDGHDNYIVEVEAIGVASRIMLVVPGDSEKEAWDVAADSLAGIKRNDLETIQIVKLT